MLARAFLADPTTGWLFPDPEGRARRLERMIAWELRSSRLTGGELVVADSGAAAALWIAPQPHPRPAGGRALAQLRLTAGALRVFGARLPAIAAAFGQVMQQLPPPPYRYLSILGTEPERQRQGLGSALVRKGLARSDQEQVLTCLHTATEADVQFYGRLGFQVAGEQRLGRGPRLIAMQRPPAAA